MAMRTSRVLTWCLAALGFLLLRRAWYSGGSGSSSSSGRREGDAGVSVAPPPAPLAAYRTAMDPEVAVVPHFNVSEPGNYLYFFHPMKTGGTSFSFMLEKVLPGGVTPGSRASGFWDKEQAQSMQATLGEHFWDGMKVAYSHTQLKAWTKVAQPPDNLDIGHITLLRDPLSLVASNFYEWICAIEPSRHAYLSEARERGEVIADKCAVPLSYVAARKAKARASKVNMCKRDPFCNADGYASFCADTDVYVAHPFHTKFTSNILATVVLGETERDVCMGRERAAECYAATVQGLSKYLWFGITEHLEDSLCLFFYSTKLQATPLGKSRLKPCRPIGVWTETAKEVVRQSGDSVVFEAALDVQTARLHQMQLELQDLQRSGVHVESLPFVGKGCYRPHTLLGLDS